MSDFSVVGAAAVEGALRGAGGALVDIVRSAYLSHDAGQTVNPPSQFLRFPDKPEARIIALPAFVGAETQVAGLKWIASFPGNVGANLARASAVLILNDYRTGYPIACLEASRISAARTAASAVLGAETLSEFTAESASIGVVGAGVISRTIVDLLRRRSWCGPVLVHDRDPGSAQALVDHVGDDAGTASLDAVLGCGLVVLATTATEPHVLRSDSFHAGQTVLNISLRDLGPDVILAAANVVDDVDHCLTAGTSPHLAEQLTGNRDFLDATLGALLAGTVALRPGRPRVFSPFGLGVLDVAVGHFVLQSALRSGTTLAVPDFFGSTERWPRR